MTAEFVAVQPTLDSGNDELFWEGHWQIGLLVAAEGRFQLICFLKDAIRSHLGGLS